MDQRRFERVSLIIPGRDPARFLHDLAVVVSHGLESLRSIDHGGQGFTTAFVLLLRRDMPSIDLENQVLGRRGTLRG